MDEIYILSTLDQWVGMIVGGSFIIVLILLLSGFLSILTIGMFSLLFGVVKFFKDGEYYKQ